MASTLPAQDAGRKLVKHLLTLGKKTESLSFFLEDQIATCAMEHASENTVQNALNLVAGRLEVFSSDVKGSLQLIEGCYQNSGEETRKKLQSGIFFKTSLIKPLEENINEAHIWAKRVKVYSSEAVKHFNEVNKSRALTRMDEYTEILERLISSTKGLLAKLGAQEPYWSV